ncbi:MAG: glycosyltransferase family 2 protein [Bacteroidales bacterium]|nr:glycosyltransferase family 2 protein [Bacteroidales bacterium]
MLKITVILLLILYTLSLLFIFIYSLSQAHVLVKYKRASKKKKQKIRKLVNFPHVTVQLPIYNELYVVERLIDSVVNMVYPIDKLEIQVLDDSTDETTAILEKEISSWKSKGFDIQHIRRNDRSGFKAGALKHGLAIAKGEFVAIFDADFTPNPDFLQHIIPHFKNQEIGMVQSRWGHINRNYSVLTHLQAFSLDAHFTIEQGGRNASGSFINFNGTGGVWRKSCIVDAGDWNGSTLTEDLDLSYRAQMKGWKFKYLENVECPAELPPVMSAIRSQQYRWTKGGAENARKHLKKVIKSDESTTTKWHAFFHLLNSAVFICILVSAITSLPLLIFKKQLRWIDNYFLLTSFFIISLIIVGIFFYVSYSTIEKDKKNKFWRFIIMFPAFLTVSMGMSLHNSIAVIEGYIGKKSPFIRTPKFNIQKNKDSYKGNIYIGTGVSYTTILEIILAVYFIVGVALAFVFNDFTLFIFHLLLSIGYLIMVFLSVFQAKGRIRRKVAV